jgi:hypothetical protein
MRLTLWDQSFSTAQTNTVLHRLALVHLEKCPDKHSSEYLRVSSALGSRPEQLDLKALCTMDLSPLIDVATYRHLRQVLAFFSKRGDIDVGIDTKAVAWETFLETERKCAETNEIFRLYARGGFFFPPRVESVLFLAQRKIASILGDLPSLSDITLRHGPGATTSVKKKNASARRKLAQKFAISRTAEHLLGDVLSEMPGWSGFNRPLESPLPPYSLAKGKVEFVPKNAKTARTIGVEPDLNQMVQLGIGDYMAKRLRVRGIDIRRQEPNQLMAREGSITGALATLDLRSASGTIATLFVESMLPWEWFDFLRSFRTFEYQTPSGDLRLQQFSSMGNGFTFPLQTLIFYALVSSCVQPSQVDRVRVYGDDIVCPTDSVELVLEVLRSCGFLVNMNKSYWEGPFRESCGKDYVSGTDVRPIYQDGALSGVSCFSLHNFYVRDQQPELAQIVLEYIDESLRIWGPDGYGDGHLLGDWQPKPFRRSDGWGGYTFETFTRKSIKAFYRLGADYVFPLYSIYLRESGRSAEWQEYSELSSQRGSRVTAGEAKLLLRNRCPEYRSIRPDRGAAVYSMHNGRSTLVDILPGYEGYKRIKVYTFSGT